MNNRGDSTRRRRRAGLLDTFSSLLAAQGRAKVLAVSILLSGALFYAAYTYILSPADQENVKARGQLDALLAKNEEARQVERTKEEFFREYKRILQNYETAKELLPAEVEVSRVLGAVQDLAVKSGVKLTRIDLSQNGVKSPSATPLYERIAPAQVVGTHKQVAEFLASIASFPRIIHVREINIQSLKPQKESVDLVIAAFYAPPPGELPPVPNEVLALAGQTTSSGGRH